MSEPESPEETPAGTAADAGSRLPDRLKARAEETHARLHDARTTRPWLDVPWSAVEREFEFGGGLIAGGLAYRFFLWLLPLGLVVAAIAGFWYDANPGGVESTSGRLGLSAAIVRSVAGAVSESKHSDIYLLAAGGVFLAYFTLGAVRALRLASSLAWSIRPQRLRRPWRAILIFNGAYLAGLLLTVGMSWAREELEGLGVLLLFVSLGLTALLVATVLRLLPNRDPRLVAHLPGALVVAAGLQLLHLFVIWYLAPKLGRSSELYGVLGAAAVILLWLYLTSRLMTASMFLNAQLAEHRRLESRRRETP